MDSKTLREHEQQSSYIIQLADPPTFPLISFLIICVEPIDGFMPSRHVAGLRHTRVSRIVWRSRFRQNSRLDGRYWRHRRHWRQHGMIWHRMRCVPESGAREHSFDGRYLLGLQRSPKRFPLRAFDSHKIVFAQSRPSAKTSRVADQFPPALQHGSTNHQEEGRNANKSRQVERSSNLLFAQPQHSRNNRTLALITPVHDQTERPRRDALPLRI